MAGPTYISQTDLSDSEALDFQNQSQSEIDALDFLRQTTPQIEPTPQASPSPAPPQRDTYAQEAHIDQSPGQAAGIDPALWSPTDVTTPWQPPAAQPASIRQPPASAGEPAGAFSDTSGRGVQLGAAAGGPVDTSGREGFVNSSLPYALETQRKYGIPAQFTLALAVNEHGGQSRYMPGTNNFFGIQGGSAGDGSGTPYVDWRPGPNGEQVQYQATARNFASPQEGFDYFGKLIGENPRYADAIGYYRQTGDLAGFVQRVHQAGYAEDPAWSDKVTRLAKEMPTADTPSPAVSATMAAAPGRQRTPAPAQELPDQSALSDPDRWALCGPVAAVAAALRYGKDWTVAQAKQIAQEHGLWDAGSGMHGLQSEVQLINERGVPAATGPADPTKMAHEVGAGNTVIVSTQGHYYTLTDFDPKTGKFDTGSSGTVYRGGSRWLSLDDMQRLSGPVQGAAYIDNPDSPIPSVATDMASNPAANPPQANQTRQDLPSTFGQTVSQGYDQLRSLFQQAPGAVADAARSGQLGTLPQTTMAGVDALPGIAGAIQASWNQPARHLDMPTVPPQDEQPTGQTETPEQEYERRRQAYLETGQAPPAVQPIEQPFGDPTMTRVMAGVQRQEDQQQAAAAHPPVDASIAAGAPELGVGGDQGASKTPQGGLIGFLAHEVLPRAEAAAQGLDDATRDNIVRQDIAAGLDWWHNHADPFRGVARVAAGAEQIRRDDADQLREYADLDSRARAGDTSVLPRMRQIETGLQQSFDQTDPFQAASRNPNLPSYEAKADIAAGIVGMAVAPGLSAGLARNLLALAIAPESQASLIAQDAGILGLLRSASAGARAVGAARAGRGLELSGTAQIESIRTTLGADDPARRLAAQEIQQGGRDLYPNNPQWQRAWDTLEQRSATGDVQGATDTLGQLIDYHQAQRPTGVVTPNPADRPVVDPEELRAARATEAGLAGAAFGATQGQNDQEREQNAGFGFVAGMAGRGGRDIAQIPANAIRRLPIRTGTFAAEELVSQLQQTAIPAERILSNGAVLVGPKGEALRPSTRQAPPEGWAAPGELAGLPREQLPNRDLYERAAQTAPDEVRYLEDGYTLPSVSRQPALRARVLDLILPNQRIPPGLSNPEMEAFLDELSRLRQGIGTGETVPEVGALGALLSLASIKRGARGYPRILSNLTEATGQPAEELALRQQPDVMVTRGGGTQERGAVVRPEVTWSMIAGDTTDPVMMKMLAGMARPDAFSNIDAARAAVDGGAAELYRRIGQQPSGATAIAGSLGNVEKITGRPLNREGETVGGGYDLHWSMTEPQRWQDLTDAVLGRGPYAGVTDPEQLRILRNTRQLDLAPSGIGPTKTRFMQSMIGFPDSGTLDTRILNDVYGLTSKNDVLKLSPQEYALLEQKLWTLEPTTKYTYGAQWLPWEYLTGEHTTYNSLIGIYDNLNRFMRQADETAKARGIPIDAAIDELASNERRVQIQLSDPAEVTARLGLSGDALRALPPGAGVGQVKAAVPELFKLAQDAGVQIVGKPSTSYGGWIDTGQEPYVEGSIDLMLKGPKPAIRWVAAAGLLSQQGEKASALIYQGAGAVMEHAVGQAAITASPADLADLQPALMSVLPEGWQVLFGGKKGTLNILAAATAVPADFQIHFTRAVDFLRSKGYNIGAAAVDPAELELIDRQAAEEVVRGGPRGARIVSEGAGTGRGPAGSLQPPDQSGGASGSGSGPGAEAPALGAPAAERSSPERGLPAAEALAPTASQFPAAPTEQVGAAASGGLVGEIRSLKEQVGKLAEGLFGQQRPGDATEPPGAPAAPPTAPSAPRAPDQRNGPSIAPGIVGAGIGAATGDDTQDSEKNSALGLAAGMAINARRSPFYSQLLRVIEQKMPNRAGAGQLAGILRNSPVKPDELKWTGLDDWLKAQDRTLTKAEVLDFLKQHEVQVQEVVRVPNTEADAAIKAAQGAWGQAAERLNQTLRDSGLSDDEIRTVSEGLRTSSVPIAVWDRLTPEAKAASSDLLDKSIALEDARTSVAATRYGKYTLPGGQNYRELLLTLPESGMAQRASQEAAAAKADALSTIREAGLSENATHYQLSQAFGPDEADRLDLARMGAGNTTPDDTYQSQHWDEPNVLAHVRFDDRTDPDGKKVLFVEEFQSDWHNAGLEAGYRSSQAVDSSDWTATSAGPASDQREMYTVRDGAGRQIATRFATSPEQAIQDTAQAQSGTLNAARVPAAPFVEKTWPELAMKRVLQWAAEHGYDKVAWTTGQQQIDRYDLSKVFETIAYDPETKQLRAYEGGERAIDQKLEPDQLSGALGDALAQRLLDAPTNRFGEHVLEGDDLRAGGEGKRRFYDEQLKNVANKIVRKWGTGVTDTKVNTKDVPVYTAVQNGDGWSVARNGVVAPNAPVVSRREWAEGDAARMGGGGFGAGWEDAHTVDVTPQMRDSVLKEGLPLFAAIPALTDDNQSDEDKSKNAAVAVVGALGMRRLTSPRAQNVATAAIARQSAKGVTWGDRAKAVGYSAMIGPGTALVNLSGNGLEIAWQLPKDLVVQPAERGLGPGLRIYAGEVMGGFGGMQHAGLALLDSLQGLHAPGGFQPASQRATNPYDKAFLTMLELGSRVFTQAPDALREVGFGMGAHREVGRIVAEQGLSGQPAAQRYQQLIGDFWQQRGPTRARAGQTPALQMPEYDRILTAANDLADHLSFQRPLGEKSQKMQDALEASGPIGHIVMPFYKTPVNMLANLAEKTPLGGSARQSRAEKAYDMLVGTALLAGLGGLAVSTGAITGSGPNDTQKRQELEAQGWQRYSTRIGKYLIPNIAFGEFAPALNAAGELGDLMRYKKTGGSPRDLISDALKRGGTIVTDMPYLRGLADVVQALKDPASIAESYASSNLARLVPYAATSRTIAGAIDPLDRQAEHGRGVAPEAELRQRLEVSTGYGRQSVPARQDILGRDVPNPRWGGAALLPKITEAKPDRTLQAFESAAVDIGPPPTSIRMQGQDVPLNAAEQRAYRRIMGQIVQRETADAVAGTAKPDQPAVLKKVLEAARKEAADTVSSRWSDSEIAKRAKGG